tara:strand:- start:43 stop:873 length:831 start_codon:yes stop_codon:yes gene_type:complete
MRVMIVGHGYVGSAVASIFKDDEKVIIDPKLNNNKISDFAGNRFMAVFVCVDTPKGNNTTVLNQVLGEINEYIGNATPVCCKSTSTPEYYGWAEEHYSNIKVLHSPEYLDSKNNIEKFRNQTFCIVGGDKIAAQIVTSIFCTRLKYLDCKNTHVTDIRTAALVKYSENFFLGMKVTYFNELYEIHKRMGCESTFDEFRALSGADPRIGTSHTQVPGWDGSFGWGGHCLDKDNHEFMNFSESSLVEFIVNLNKIHRGKTHEHSKLAAPQQEGEETNS